MAGAFVTVLGYLIAPFFIRKYGNYSSVLFLILVQILIFYGLITSTNSQVIAFLFILQSAIIALIGLCLDIFLEAYTDSAHVGTIRGIYSATLNASWVIAPLIGSMLIGVENNYRNTYIAALAMLFPLIYLIYRNFPRFKDPNYIHLSPVQLVKHISHNHNWIKLFTANTILQVFYAWMTVYCPIYLNKTMGFGWESIGIILTIMLIPFPLIQYPIGKFSDNKHREKTIMSIGFAIMGIFTIVLAFISIPSIALWALVLFITRIGAASAEVMIETYFFKTVSPRDTATLGIFRITRPLSFFIAPIITMIGLLFIANNYLFVVIGIITLFAIYPISRIHSIK